MEWKNWASGMPQTPERPSVMWHSRAHACAAKTHQYALKDGREGLDCGNGAMLLGDSFPLGYLADLSRLCWFTCARGMEGVRTCLSHIPQLCVPKTSQQSAGTCPGCTSRLDTVITPSSNWQKVTNCGRPAVDVMLE